MVQSLEHEDPPKEVLRSVVESVISSHDYGSGAEALVNELCAEDGLACVCILPSGTLCLVIVGSGPSSFFPLIFFYMK